MIERINDQAEITVRYLPGGLVVTERFHASSQTAHRMILRSRPPAA